MSDEAEQQQQRQQQQQATLPLATEPQRAEPLVAQPRTAARRAYGSDLSDRSGPWCGSSCRLLRVRVDRVR